MSRGASAREKVRLAARAKLNLRLNVLAREASGYHQLETLFCALDFADDVEVAIGGRGIRLDIEGADDLPAGPDNLVHRAAVAFFEASDKPAAATIRLRKRIPSGAGLGGGSSDAASTLRALNLLTGSPLHDEQLVQIGARLGSDVPFFLCGSSFALAWGRGDRLLPLQPLPPLSIVLVVPEFRVVTADAFRDLAASRAESNAPAAAVLHAHRLAGWEAIAEDAVNDFEPVVFEEHPQLAHIKRALHDYGASIALMSGSGSTMFGAFTTERVASRAARRIREAFPSVRTIETATNTWTSANG